MAEAERALKLLGDDAGNSTLATRLSQLPHQPGMLFSQLLSPSPQSWHLMVVVSGHFRFFRPKPSILLLLVVYNVNVLIVWLWLVLPPCSAREALVDSRKSS